MADSRPAADDRDGAGPAMRRPPDSWSLLVDSRPPRRDGGEEWMLTYMDTVTLLVTLFVLLLSFATFNPARFEEVAQALSLKRPEAGNVAPRAGRDGLPSIRPPGVSILPDDGRGILPQVAPVVPGAGRAPVPDRPAEELAGPAEAGGEEAGARPDTDREAALRRALAMRGLADGVSVEVGDNVVDLRLNESLLFRSGEADITGNGAALLQRLLPLLAGSGFAITVEGHTDNVPVGTAAFPSNWELSGARAAAVVRRLVDLGVEPQRLSTAGFADTRPIAGNESESGRRANRRVNILLHVSAPQMQAILDGG